MNIAQFVEADAPGGTERLVLQMAQDLRRRGHRVIIMGPANGPGKGWLSGEVRSLGFDWMPIPKRSMLDPRAIQDVSRVLRAHNIDVLHSHEFAPAVFGAVAAWLLRRTHVMTMHSNLYFAGAWRRRAAFRWATAHSAGVVAVSADTRNDAERLLQLPAGTVQVIPNGIASSPGVRHVVRHELGLRDDELLIVALGNVSARKSQITILQALDVMHQRNPALPWRFAIAGTDQGAAPSLLQYAEAHGLTQRVRLLGHRSDTENILAAADIFAMSSTHEGMPLAVMEAMFASKPVISTAAGGIAEMFTAEVEGLLTPVGDVGAMALGLERLLTDGALRSRLGAAARIRAERQFGIAPMVEAYFRLYDRGPRGKQSA